MPNVPYQTYNPEQWQQILSGAVHAHDLNAVRDAANALNQYEKESQQRTEWSSAPAELGAVAKGVGQGLIGIPGGIKALAGQLGQGDIPGAAKSIWSGLESMGKGIAGAAEVGADAMDPRKLGWAGLGGDPNQTYEPMSEELSKIQTGASTLPGLGLAKLGEGPIKRGIAKAGGSVLSGTLGKLVKALKGTAEEIAPDAAEATGEAAQAGTAGANPVGSPRPTVRGGGKATPGYGGKSQGIDVTGMGPTAKAAPAAPTLGDYTGANAQQAVADAIRTRGIGSLEDIVNKNAQPKPLDTGTQSNSPVNFDEDAPASGPVTPETIEALLKQMTKTRALGNK